jgi:deoxyribose-phosphate aldolase
MDKKMTKAELAAKIDHTLLKATATPAQIQDLCSEAVRYGFASVCVNPRHVPLAAKALSGQKPLVCAVIGFPLGANDTEIKAEEARLAVKYGAREIDMVIDLGSAKAGDWKGVQDDIRAVVKASGKAIVKVIIECCYLSDAEKARACEAARAAGARFVKTSTGFGPSGATLDDVKLMRQAAGPDMLLKAAGGIRTTKDALSMIAAGADRIGSSCGVEIVMMLEES